METTRQGHIQTAEQEQVQRQVLTSLQVELARQLEMPMDQLSEYIDKALNENLALERIDDDSDDTNNNEGRTENDGPDADGNDRDDEADYYGGDGDVASAFEERRHLEDDLPSVVPSAAREAGHNQFLSRGPSFYESLMQQAHTCDIDERELQILEYLIGSLDDNGLLLKTIGALVAEMTINLEMTVTSNEVKDAVRLLQTFDPPGVGAMSPRECFLLQLRQSDYKSPLKALEIDIIERSFDDFLHKRFNQLTERHHVDEETIRQVYDELSHRLAVRPSSQANDTEDDASPVVVPDFIVTEEDGELIVTINDAHLPRVRLSAAFQEALRAGQNDSFTKDSVFRARTFIATLQQRHITLLRTMESIVKHQKAFFLEGDEMLLRPLTMGEVAADVGCNLSSVSRVCNNKYVKTDFGVFRLRSFFPTCITDANGEEVVRARVNAIIHELIENEDHAHPMSDDELTEKINREGFQLARRTVAKYRDRLGYPVARLRRK